jgi:hypothetical protein
MREYNEERPHDTLDWMPPASFLARMTAGSSPFDTLPTDFAHLIHRLEHVCGVQNNQPALLRSLPGLLEARPFLLK